jgi:AraC-like DNA-binding protein
MLEFISEPDRKRSLSPDDRLLRKILDIINRYIPDPGFDMDQMAGELNMSRSQLFRKVRAVTGHTPNDLLRVVRLKRAANLFKHGHKNISRVMYEVGFNNQSYFSGCFRDLFKMNPSEYIKSKSTGDQ